MTTSMKKENAFANIVFMILPAVILIAVILVAWQAYCVTGNIPEWQMPSPSGIIKACFTGFSESLPYLQSTYFCIIIGFLLSVVVGIGLALLLSNSRILSAALTPLIVILCCVPMVTLVPLLLISMGTGPGPKILAIVIQCFPIINMNTCVGFANVDSTRIELMKSLKATKVEMYRYCIFRDAMPNIFTGIRLASVLAMISGVSAELCGGSGGLGNNISTLLGLSRTSEAFGCLIYIIILGLIIYGLVTQLERKLTKGMGM